MPIELVVCPTCHNGIKPSRGWTWIDLASLTAGAIEPFIGSSPPRGCDIEVGCGPCPIATRVQQVGLIWIGEKFYPQVQDFMREADTMGLSRRIAMIPRGFTLGETWVALAHRKVIRTDLLPGGDDNPENFKPGIFHLFQPARLEYVVKDDDSQEKLERIEERGMTLVKVEEVHE